MARRLGVWGYHTVLQVNLVVWQIGMGLSIHEAARLAGVPYETARRWVAKEKRARRDEADKGR
jgi:transposase